MGDWAVGLEFNDVFMKSKRIQLETKVSQEWRVTKSCPTLTASRSLIVDKKMTWKQHIQHISDKISRTVALL